jgi:hypothetical protein
MDRSTQPSDGSVKKYSVKWFKIDDAREVHQPTSPAHD